MNLLTWLVAGHLVGDYLLQNRWMAVNKSEKWLALIVHCVLYSFTVGVFGYLGGGVRIYGLIIVFLSHVMLDKRTFVTWWAKKVTQSADIPWLIIMIDQTWHVVVLVIVCLV